MSNTNFIKRIKAFYIGFAVLSFIVMGVRYLMLTPSTTIHLAIARGVDISADNLALVIGIGLLSIAAILMVGAFYGMKRRNLRDAYILKFAGTMAVFAVTTFLSIATLKYHHTVDLMQFSLVLINWVGAVFFLFSTGTDAAHVFNSRRGTTALIYKPKLK